MSGAGSQEEHARIGRLVMAEALRDVRPSEKIVLWGAGGAGERFYPHLKDRIAMVVDSAPGSALIGGGVVAEPPALLRDRPDVILVATDAIAEVAKWVESRVHPAPRIIDLQRSLPWHCTSMDGIGDQWTEIACRLEERGAIRVMKEIVAADQQIVLASPSGALALHEQRGALSSGHGPSLRVYLDRSAGLSKQGSLLPAALAQSLLVGASNGVDSTKLRAQLAAFFAGAATVYGARGLAIESTESAETGDGCPSTPGFLSWARSILPETLPSETLSRVGYCTQSRQLGVFILREAARQDGRFLEAVVGACEQAGVTLLDTLELKSEALRAKATQLTRGGVWDETAASERGGLPWLIVVLAHPDVPEDDRSAIRPPRWIQAIKAGARKRVADRFPSERVNWLHSTDDAHEANEVLNFLREDGIDLGQQRRERRVSCSAETCLGFVLP